MWLAFVPDSREGGSKPLEFPTDISVFVIHEHPWITPEFTLRDETTLCGGWSLVRAPMGLEGWGFELTQPPGRGMGQESEFSIMAND